MFDIGFSELVVIAVVALIVIGPERLPKAARTMGHLFGRLQRYVNDVKADISREIELDELRNLQKQVQTAAADLKSSVEGAARDVETGVRNVESELNAGATDSAITTDAETARAFEPSPLPNEPGGEMGDATASQPPRQPSLPGLDKI
jgi:sec-independent protein translocase protein TatB